MNLTSQDVMALYPQYLYEAVLKTATGRDDLKFTVTTAQFPLVKKQRDREETASGIFVAFVVGVGMALQDLDELEFLLVYLYYFLPDFECV